MEDDFINALEIIGICFSEGSAILHMESDLIILAFGDNDKKRFSVDFRLGDVDKYKRKLIKDFLRKYQKFLRDDDKKRRKLK